MAVAATQRYEVYVAPPLLDNAFRALDDEMRDLIDPGHVRTVGAAAGGSDSGFNVQTKIGSNPGGGIECIVAQLLSGLVGNFVICAS